MVPDIYSSESGPGGWPEDVRQLEGISQLESSFIAGRSARAKSRSARERGFTLTELMIVVAVIAVVATIAFVGLRNNQFEGAYLRFTDDLVGTMVQARNRAIDDQTTVRVEVSATQVEVFWIDPESPVADPLINGTGVLLWGNYINNVDGGLIAAEACITGMEPGITPPSQPNNAQMPTQCGTDLPKSILFRPDGGFELQNEPLPDANPTTNIHQPNRRIHLQRDSPYR